MGRGLPSAHAHFSFSIICYHNKKKKCTPEPKEWPTLKLEKSFERNLVDTDRKIAHSEQFKWLEQPPISLSKQTDMND